MRAMDWRNVATRSAGVLVWKLEMMGIDRTAGWFARTESRILFLESA
jgi:hypothetical protein